MTKRSAAEMQAAEQINKSAAFRGGACIAAPNSQTPTPANQAVEIISPALRRR
jgi:hypothetical protein